MVKRSKQSLGAERGSALLQFEIRLTKRLRVVHRTLESIAAGIAVLHDRFDDIERSTRLDRH